MNSATPDSGAPVALPVSVRPDATAIRQLCASGAGVILDNSVDMAVVTTDLKSVTLRQHRVPSAAELDRLQVVAGVRLHGDSYMTSMDSAAFEAALAELRPAFLEPPQHTIDVSIMPMTAPSMAAVVRVDLGLLAPFLDDVGERGAIVGLDDMQGLLGRMVDSKVVTVDGLIADLDHAVEDPAREHALRGAPTPNVTYPTEHGGARLLYAFVAPIAHDDRHGLGLRESLFHVLNLAFPGLDKRSLDVRQRQYLPTILRTTKGPRRLVRSMSVQLASTPLDLARFVPTLPRAVLGALGLGVETLTVEERHEVSVFLETLGVVLPSSGKFTGGRRCPLKQHGAAKVAAGRTSTGAIWLTCLGGHGGAGPTRWSEDALLRLARGGES